MEISMGIIKVEISIPEGIKALSKFKENRIRAFEEITSEVKESVSKAINGLLNTEMTVFLGEPDQTDNKRNGHKERNYTLKGIGSIRLKMPQDRKSRFKSSVIPKNEVIDPRLKEDLAVLHLGGLSTRTLAMISKRLLGIDLSTNTVSASLGLVESRALEWLQRPLEKTYWALYIDGTNFRIQRRGSTELEPSLVVLGIDDRGHKSILAIEPGHKDNAESWKAVFSSLVERGLSVQDVKIGIMDGLPGLESLFKTVFPNAATQRCWVHSLRNALGRVPKRLRDAFKELASKIMYAASRDDALRALTNLKMAMGNDARRAVYTIEKDIDSLITYYQFDPSFWNSLKTTNPIERINRELKRRTKPMGTLSERTLEIVVAFVALKIESGWRRAPVNAPQYAGNLPSMKMNTIESSIGEIFSIEESQKLRLCEKNI